ncbi:hypothetical protein IHE37_08215 [Acinetobacter towneri]|uniref:hypothetical protein n=1 Tax=Acinetobacter towneri TaxID=202956 RepID=UPI001F619443|nr:hypothetical protein [Acinetobacter towneri]UNT63699.1 hypothetical protein IHE37_08215 [Acinetobacter towneri]
MTQITCPFCHSDNLVTLSPQQAGLGQLEVLLEAMSPAAMAALGVKLSRQLDIPPIVGGLIGVVVGGGLMLVNQQILSKYQSLNHRYLCNGCQNSFVSVAA